MVHSVVYLCVVVIRLVCSVKPLCQIICGVFDEFICVVITSAAVLCVLKPTKGKSGFSPPSVPAALTYMKPFGD